MEVDIKVKMGEKTCGECPCHFSFDWGEIDEYEEHHCLLFDTMLDGKNRCPECLSKHGTGDKLPGVEELERLLFGPDPRDAVVAAARRAKKLHESMVADEGVDGLKMMAHAMTMDELYKAVAALDAEGGKG